MGKPEANRSRPVLIKFATYRSKRRVLEKRLRPIHIIKGRCKELNVVAEFPNNGGGANSSDECEADIVPHTCLVSQTQSRLSPTGHHSNK